MGKRIKNPTNRVRRRIYEIAIALVGLAILYGLVNGDEAEAWLALVAAALGLARANVPAD